MWGSWFVNLLLRELRSDLVSNLGMLSIATERKSIEFLFGGSASIELLCKLDVVFLLLGLGQRCVAEGLNGHVEFVSNHCDAFRRLLGFIITHVFYAYLKPKTLVGAVGL